MQLQSAPHLYSCISACHDSMTGHLQLSMSILYNVAHIYYFLEIDSYRTKHRRQNVRVLYFKGTKFNCTSHGFMMCISFYQSFIIIITQLFVSIYTKLPYSIIYNIGVQIFLNCTPCKALSWKQTNMRPYQLAALYRRLLKRTVYQIHLHSPCIRR